MPSSRPLRILLFANSVTLTHLVRPLQIANALVAAGHQPVVAAPDRWASILGGWSGPRRRIDCPTPEAFMDALAKGRPVFTEASIRAMVDEDLALIDELRPDVVVGDFRISLGVSARVRGVPYANLINAYWNPAAQVLPWPIPDHLLARLVGVGCAEAVFRLVQPMVRRQQAGPVDAVRRRHGLPTHGDLRAAYCDADLVLHPDPPGLVPLAGGGPPRTEIGHLAWAPATPLPAWWAGLPPGRSCVYVCMGSSGSVKRLDAIIAGAARTGMPVMVATAGRTQVAGRAGVFAADWLPGDAAAARARVVVCNGGSPSAYQALAAGAPVLGLATNLDQHLAMGVVERAGLGRRIRSGSVSAAGIAAGITGLLADELVSRRVEAMAQSMARQDPLAAAVAAVVGLAGRSGLRQVG